MSTAATLLRTLADSLDAGERSLLWEVEEALQAIAKETDDRAYARAARALMWQTSPGRPPLNDNADLSEAISLYEQGVVPSMNRAFDRIAKRRNPYADPRTRRSHTERLRRKHAKTKKVSTQ